MSNQGHDIAKRLSDRANKEWSEPGRQAIAQFLEKESRQMKLFADVFDTQCGVLVKALQDAERLEAENTILRAEKAALKLHLEEMTAELYVTTGGRHGL